MFIPKITKRPSKESQLFDFIFDNVYPKKISVTKNNFEKVFDLFAVSLIIVGIYF